MKLRFFIKHRYAFPWLILLIWALVCLLINPVGDFPLNDDFSFGRTVYNLTERDQLLFDQWLGMTLIAQVGWGSIFCKMFGFSFTTLRLSTLILAFIGMLGIYRIGKELGHTTVVSLFLALVFAFNPLICSLSFSFMTDVPFLTCAIIATFFFLKHYNTDQSKWLILAIVFSLFATFIRQLGLMLPIAFAGVWLLSFRWHLKEVVKGIAPLLLSILLLYGYQKWFEATQNIPETYGTFGKLFKRVGHENFFSDCMDRIGILLMYMGLFLFPISVLYFKRINYRKLWPWISCCTLLGAWCMLGIYDRFPWGNIFFNWGLGPKLLKDGYFFINVSPTLPVWTLRSVAIFAVFGGLLLLAHLVHFLSCFDFKPHIGGPEKTKMFTLINILVYGGFLLLDTHFFDRYFIPLIPFFLILISYKTEKGTQAEINAGPLKPIPVLSLCVLIFFSVSATHDYLSWNRARWKALNYLTKEKNISPYKIDGGYEFNGWHRRTNKRNEGTSKSWWWVEEDEYAVAFGDLKGLGFKKEKGFPFKTWLPVGVDSVFVLKKDLF